MSLFNNQFQLHAHLFRLTGPLHGNSQPIATFRIRVAPGQKEIQELNAFLNTAGV